MTTVVLGAGAVGTATAWYLRKSGHDVVLVERQKDAAMETSWGNGGVIHASEVEPWSQPGMPMKLRSVLGNAPSPFRLKVTGRSYKSANLRKPAAASGLFTPPPA